MIVSILLLSPSFKLFLICKGLIIVPLPLPKSIICPSKVLAKSKYSACGSITTTLLLAANKEVSIFLVKVVLPLPEVPKINILKLVRLPSPNLNNLKVIGYCVISDLPKSKLLLSFKASVSKGQPIARLYELIQ